MNQTHLEGNDLVDSDAVSEQSLSIDPNCGVPRRNKYCLIVGSTIASAIGLTIGLLFAVNYVTRATLRKTFEDLSVTKKIESIEDAESSANASARRLETLMREHDMQSLDCRVLERDLRWVNDDVNFATCYATATSEIDYKRVLSAKPTSLWFSVTANTTEEVNWLRKNMSGYRFYLEDVRVDRATLVAHIYTTTKIGSASPINIFSKQRLFEIQVFVDP